MRAGAVRNVRGGGQPRSPCSHSPLERFEDPLDLLFLDIGWVVKPRRGEGRREPTFDFLTKVSHSSRPRQREEPSGSSNGETNNQFHLVPHPLISHYCQTRIQRMNDEYAGAVNEAVGRIRATIPADLAGKFAAAGGITKEDFQPFTPTECGEVCAVDGSNVMLLESGSMGLAVVRAAQTSFRNMERTRRSLTPLKFALIGPEPACPDFVQLYAECFGENPGT